jgi:Flavin-binding monooxygenase-like
VVVAIGLFWYPKVPDYPGAFSGAMIHSHEYRRPEPFTARRVLVVGAGQSAAEIAVEVSRVASRTFISVRSGTHVLPRWIDGKPYDTRDIDPLNRIPWRLTNLLYGSRVTRELGPTPASWPVGAHRILDGIPIISSDLLPAVGRAEVVVKPAIDRLGQDRVHFVDGSEECWIGSFTAPATA